MFGKNYIGLMVIHCDRILHYIKGITYQDWVDNWMLQDAVCKRLDSLTECIKEHLKRNPSIRDEFPGIPWDDIVAFRNRDVHHYESTNFDVVWEIIERDILPLNQVIKTIAERQ
jgi:uncharacterized protein with HEPN domain